MNSVYFNTGLNLQYCKKIIFVEPIYGNKEYKESIKNQIIGRINRIGQTDKIDIITFIIKDTIEEEIV
jgi:SNF2 family DNA or RNA helicase